MKTQKEAKREQIIAAAIKVFSQKGYHQTRMEEIAAEAGIGKGTVYEYFSSKIQLFQAMMDEGFHQYYSKFDVDQMQDLPFERCIQLLTEAHMHFCIENKELTRVLFMEQEAPDEELWHWANDNRTRKLQALEELVVGSIERGEIRSVDPRLLSYVIQASMVSFCIPVIMDDWNIEPAYFAQQYTDIIMNGIGGS